MADYMATVKKIVERNRLQPRSDCLRRRTSGKNSLHGTESFRDELGKSDNLLTSNTPLQRKSIGQDFGKINENTGEKFCDSRRGSSLLSLRLSSRTSTGSSIKDTNRISDEVFRRASETEVASAQSEHYKVNNESSAPVLLRRQVPFRKERRKQKEENRLSSGAKMLLLARAVKNLPLTNDPKPPDLHFSDVNTENNESLALSTFHNSASVTIRSKAGQTKVSPKNRQTISFSRSVPLSSTPESDERLSRRHGELQLKMDTIRSELMTMQKTDEEIARKLLAIYQEIKELKVKRSCLKHEKLLDDAIFEAELADELPEMCDVPQKAINKLLSSHGVTSYNIHTRRFSCS